MQSALGGERVCSELHRGRDTDPLFYSVVSEPELDPDGCVMGVVVVIFDITERKRSEEHIRLLLREVNHRSKNLLSVVSAIARQTKAPTHQEFARRFAERVHALATSHDLLAKSEWHSISLMDLLRTQLDHFNELFGVRVHFRGPSLLVSAAAAQCLGMVVHELSTNAAKHGALSNHEGSIEIAWHEQDESTSLTWTERGGPPVTSPDQRGYGSFVITTMAELALGGIVNVAFAPSGLTWHLTCPTSRIQGTADALGAPEGAYST
jgi:two-component sensor histidine kinase